METLATPSLTAIHIESFKKIVGEQFVFVDEESLNNYGHDETENLHYSPEVVIKPRTADEKFVIRKEYPSPPVVQEQVLVVAHYLI